MTKLPFNKVYDAYLDEGAKVVYASRGGFLKPSKARKVSEKNHQERRRVQAATFMALHKVLGEDTEELVDLFAGSAISTLPLLVNKRIRRLVLLDSEYGNPNTKTEARYARPIIKQFGFEAKVELLAEEIRQGREFSRQKIRDVSLLGTGFALRKDWRRDLKAVRARPDFEKIKDNPKLHRVNHSAQHASELDLRGIQGTLSGPEEKRLHIFETPFIEPAPSAKEMQAYVESQVASDWHLAEWQSKNPHSSFYARLEKPAAADASPKPTTLGEKILTYFGRFQ